jgi:hypothetical protein
MFQFKHFAAASAFVILMSGTAHAALTADQVWQSWKDAAGMVGLEITAATESNSGGVLMLNGISIAPPGEQDAITISDMTLTTESDGSVTIRPGASIGLTGAGDGNGGFSLTHDDLVLTAHEGDAGALIYDYAANSLTVAVDASYEGYSFDPNKPAQLVKNLFNVSMEGLSGSYSDTPGSNRTFGLDLNASKMAYDIVSDDPNMEMKTAQESTTEDISLSGTFTMPATMPLFAIASATDFGLALKDGLALTLSATQGASTGSATQEDAFFPYQMTMSAPGGEGTISFDKDAFALKSEGGGLQMSMTSTAIPAPVELTSGPVSMDILTPVTAGDAPGDYHLKMMLSQFALNDAVWGLFDPGAALKREPLDLAIDVSGKGIIDWIGLIAAEEMGGQPPIPQLESLDITTLALKVAGVALDGTGAFTFDNSMGFPAPLGQADVSVTGANALIDGLIATGLLSEDDAMGARMMMGAFMKPGAEPDSLTSTIEAKEGFQIFVNGQQIQ